MDQEIAHKHRSKLSIFEDEASILIKGDTFRYGFDKQSGLISRLEVLGDDFLQGTNSQVPDIYVSDSSDPRENNYSSRYEDEAECDVISAGPHEVHIRTHGMYHSPSGETFPIRYRITYEIQSDGTIFVMVDNKVYGPCELRWLCISRGLLKSSLCRYFSHLPDQSKVDATGDYAFGKSPSAEAGHEAMLSGQPIPWFWLGNDRTGVEICVWDVTHHLRGSDQGVDRMTGATGEPGLNVSVASTPEGILWEIFSLKDLKTSVKEVWEQIDYFALSVTPPKSYNPGFSALRAYWTGPRQYGASYEYLSDDEIKHLSLMGFNLIIGGVNWRPGVFIPDSESEARRVISTCHRHGMKVIPRISMMSLDEDAEIFKEHGPDWRIEPLAEHECKTSLMCPGAAGWRRHWFDQIDRVVSDYAFDGVYLDFEYDRLACRNPRHGCRRRDVRPTFTWLRDMLEYAWTKFKAKDPGCTIVANTDLLPISMACSWLDVRAVGASQDIRQAHRMARKAFYSSYRLGCSSLMWTDHARRIDKHAISLSLLYSTPIILSQNHSREEIDLTVRYWNVLRSFGIGEARFYPGFMDDPEIEVASSGSPNLFVNVHKGKFLLLTVVNLSPDEVRSDISLTNFAELNLQNDKEYMIYEPVSRSFLKGKERWSCDDLRTITVAVPGHSARLLQVREYTGYPVPLFALGCDKVLEEQFDKDTGTLQFQLAAPPGSGISLAVNSPVGKPACIVSAEGEIEFIWDEGQKLAIFEIQTSGATTAVEVRSP